MLSEMRRSTKSGWTYILVAVLIVVFAVFFGVPGDACGSGARRSIVATAAGTDIYNDDINPVYNRVWGGQRSIDDAELRIQQAKALRTVILIELLAEKAREHGLRVTDEEYVKWVKDPLRNPEYRAVYGRDGTFDGPLYKAYIQNQLRMSVPKYEDWKKREILAQKYLNLVEMQFQAAGWEVDELQKLRNTKVDLEFVKFDPDALDEFVPVTDEDVAAFATSDAQAIKDYYEANKADYEDPAQVLIRRIYVVKPEESDQEAAKAAIEKFEAAKKRVLEDGENFADVAGELSESEKETQGLMEWTTLENVDQNIADAVRDAKVGDVEEVTTEYSFMLVKLEEKKEATKTELSEVQDEIARKLLQEKKVRDLIDEMIVELKPVAADSESLKAAVDKLQQPDGEEGEADSRWSAVTVDTTGEFTQEGQDLAALFGRQIPGISTRSPWDRIPKIGKNPDLARDAFAVLSEEKPLAEKPYQTEGKYFFVRLADRQEPGDEDAEADPLAATGEIRSQKIQSLLGPFHAVFAVPLDDFGPYLEQMLDQAMEKGVVRLYERNFEAANLVNPDDDPVVAPAENAPTEPAPKSE